MNLLKQHYIIISYTNYALVNFSTYCHPQQDEDLAQEVTTIAVLDSLHPSADSHAIQIFDLSRYRASYTKFA